MFFAMIKKEFILVFRDKHALLALFIMPAIFILIMSISLKDQFSHANVSFNISIKTHDKSDLATKFIEDIQEDKSINILKQNADILLIIPENYFKKENIKLIINVQNTLKSDLIEILKAKLLKKFIDIKLKSIAKSLKGLSPKASKSLSSVDISSEKLFIVKYFKDGSIPSSTQQSVPSWIVFGMFFVIIPISTIYINEKKQNTLVRLNSMNVSIFKMTISKVIPYIVINQIQVWIMIGVGIFIVPLFSTPALVINGSFISITLLSIAVSISAIGLANLIAVSATSSEQATTIGGILNILLGAIGGVMIPKFIMPESMQILSNISPMSWALDGFLKIFLKNEGIFSIAKESLVLIIFGIITLIISMIILNFKIKKGL